MRTTLVALALVVAGTSVIGALTPEGLQQDLDAITTLAVFEKSWGLVAPEARVPVAEIKNLSAEQHANLIILPEQARFENGALVFTLGAKPAVVGAWNCENRLPNDRRPNLGARFDIELEIEQSVPEPTVWTLVPWANGERTQWGRAIAQARASAQVRKVDVEKYLQESVYRFCRREVAAIGRQVIKIENAGMPTRSRPGSDGVELEIKGPAGAVIKIHRITVLQKIRPGGFRKEFTLPAGAVWRAVGNVQRKTLLYVNGREVPSGLLDMRPHPSFMYGQQLQEVDLKPFLKPGQNVMAAIPAFPADANALVQASVVMVSGEVVELNTDKTWRYVPQCAKGWDTAGFTGGTQPITNEAPNDSQYGPSGTLSAIRGGWRPHQQLTLSQPAYAGRLRLQAPDDNQLYFSEVKPFRALALAPAGLAAQKPTVEWMLCRYRKGAALEMTLFGTASTFTSQGDSIEFELSGGGAKLPMGVYVLKAVLRGADSQVLEDRIPEPCLVTGRIPMTPASGKTFTDGLNLEPEAVLDLTKADDPAFPWMEMSGTNLCAEPLVVTRHGMTYRETRTSACTSLITYNYAFRHPGDFYVMELEYPDDQPRFFGVGLCSEHDGRYACSKAGPSVWTGIRHLNTGKMQPFTWLFRPDPDYTSLSLINLLPGSSAAASKLRISHVRGRLPELRTGGSERAFGILTEHSAAFCGFGVTFRSSDNPQTEQQGISGVTTVRSNYPAKVRLAALAEWLDTCNHYTEYLRWAGQNLICLSFFQYDGSRANAAPQSATGDSRLVPQLNDVAARVFRDNGIDFYCSIGYCSDPVLLEKYRSPGADLSDSPYLINGEGREARIWNTGFNFNHPAVRQSLLNVAGEAVRKFQRLPNFRGLNLVTSFAAPMEAPNYFIDDRRSRSAALEPLRYDYSDATVSRFEKDTGIKLPVSPGAPERFQQRYQLLTADALREKWIEWRAQNMLNFFLDFRDRLREIKPDVKVATGLDASAGFFFEYAQSSGQNGEQSMREFGWDFGKFHGQEGLYTLPWLQGSGCYGFMDRYTSNSKGYEKYLQFLRSNTDPTFLKIGDGAVERMMMVHYGWLELEQAQKAVLPERPHWQVPYQYTMYGAPQGDAGLEPFQQAMAATDPDSVFYGFTDTNLKIGGEQPLREFAQFLRSLPKAKFVPFNGPDTELVVRTLSQDAQLLFYALNPAPWPVEAILQVKDAKKVVNLISGETCSAPVKVVIPAYHGASFAAAGNRAALGSWHTEGTGEMFPQYLKHMSNAVGQVGQWLGNGKVNTALLPEQQQTLQRLLQDAQQALVNRKYAAAWQLLNSWDFTWCSYLLEKQGRTAELVTEANPPPPATGKRTIVAQRAEAPPVIDGKLGDPAWQKTSPQGAFMAYRQASVVGTEVRLAWDDKNLYLGFVCRDNFPDRLKKDARQESEIMQGDDVLVFLLQPDLSTTRHYQMAFNAGCVKFDQQDRDNAFAPDWKVAVQQGTNGWTAEAAFPLAALETAPAAGAKWGANFCRVFRQNLVPVSTWSFMAGDWHNPAGYGVIEFK